ncbi:MAG: hypothetical protein Q7U04_14785 [Bacteriovorax sp.]|nr:hypothetical protein [Bacteriovorax sp.]
MKTKLFVSFFLFFLFSTSELRSESRSLLFLRGHVPASISTNVKESKLNANQSLWLFSSQMNTRYPAESQKFEIEGLDQSGLESHIKKVVGSDRTIQYEVLINHLKSTLPIDRPIFLKISAN